MKKVLVILLVVFLLGSVAYAKSDSSKGKGKDKPKTEAAEIEGKSTVGGSEMKAVKKAKNKEELKKMKKEKEKELDEEAAKMGGKKEKVYKKQNRVRAAVHSLLAMEGMAGGIGPEVSKIAREFNNSCKKTTDAEVKIEERSKMREIFMGGDEKAAEEIEVEVQKNRTLLERLKDLRNQAPSGDVKVVMDEQIQVITEENDRLKELAEKEKKLRGLFNW